MQQGYTIQIYNIYVMEYAWALIKCFNIFQNSYNLKPNDKQMPISHNSFKY